MVNVRARTVSCFSLHVGENVWVLTTFYFLLKISLLTYPKKNQVIMCPENKTHSEVTGLVMADGPCLICVLLWGLGWPSGADASEHVGLSQFGERYVI